MNALLKVENLMVEDAQSGEQLVKNLSFDLFDHQCLGIVGESGSGKSMTARSILGLLPPWLRAGGSVHFKKGAGDCQLINGSDTTLRAIRRREICLIPQDSMTAFDPLMPIGKQMAETFTESLGMSKKEALAHGPDCLGRLNIGEPGQVVQKYPHQLSGGMLKRCMIAMALAVKPKVIIADEPTTALDAISQKQVVEAFEMLREKNGTALIFISHDLGVTNRLADDLLVMERGEGVEYGPAKALFKSPKSSALVELVKRRRQINDAFKKAMGKEPKP